MKLVKRLSKALLLHVPDLARLAQALADDEPTRAALARLLAELAERYCAAVRAVLELPASPAAPSATASLSPDQAAAFASCIVSTLSSHSGMP